MNTLGWIRVAAVAPTLQVADVAHNLAATQQALQEAESAGVAVCIFPEMGLTGYTCNDLFHQRTLLRASIDALLALVRWSESAFAGLFAVGLPVEVDGQIFNVAAVIHRGQLLGLVPKRYLPNYQEFYDARYFASAATLRSSRVSLIGSRDRADSVPIGTDLLFQASDWPALTLGVEICEDVWMPVPPSSLQALNGATLLANLSASPEGIGKVGYRRQLIASQSGRCLAGYIYAAAGGGESTTDLVFGGHCLIAENGTILAESPRFQSQSTCIISEIDLERLQFARAQTTSFATGTLTPELATPMRTIAFRLERDPAPLPPRRRIDAHPFVPAGHSELRDRCEEIFSIQVGGLSKRLAHLGDLPVTIGVSGGLDSTLALLVACKTMDRRSRPRRQIQAMTMPGFGTTNRTYTNAKLLMSELGVSSEEIDIRGLCLEQFRQLRHRPFGLEIDGLTVEQFTEQLRQLPAERRRHDLTFENVQARMRTSLLMNRGFVIGTGDLSELALGWCTYNADHMSMYNVNGSVPKTLVKFLVNWAAEHQFQGAVQAVLRDVVATEISPELLPPAPDGRIEQTTESLVGPYELHDFFLFHFLRAGASPRKILELARYADFDGDYSMETIRHWLKGFVRRFFASQYKRSCLPDGPKVGSVSLSPRGDWRMPTDAVAELWLRDLDADAIP
ncbi:NAD(+) synthase [Tuwongella immobilis]|uniref:Glutamine-dependent NAD(+) synthetase n=1 Tax=Tuwongella immobilis TaxID=692036 RepID=A0A6C2YY72_9BACT|nr:NAD(+) synthase [Tuwongella immobilis]VIP05685.1 nad synthetase : Glutamine-dependent NAD(+) synthetase NadE OS=Clostridium stercorarium subsp. stercorarium (strain ATCC 35414 / DSM 8532 / NCIMB 11754) GN=nadE PE=3 SV=1: CN_hydrolase: NAD_synthase [Tuwongella immobilis]VTS08726.1 nad synthetase : Glutamine-dependent NAD(+) synthetase NadE OS=Clostridium stercorarium subsp. stercorarium (strain ATCC 35414 / DSM 8532 / NCIMB 11754) GN=nadE PE=3 SV=1: CN_hydrolase: NAD_synthase [Tuwongella immobi